MCIYYKSKVIDICFIDLLRYNKKVLNKNRKYYMSTKTIQYQICTKLQPQYHHCIIFTGGGLGFQDNFHTIICLFWSECSELLENLDEMFPRHYMHSSIFNMFKSSNTHLCTYIHDERHIIEKLVFFMTTFIVMSVVMHELLPVHGKHSFKIINEWYYVHKYVCNMLYLKPQACKVCESAYRERFNYTQLTIQKVWTYHMEL